MFATNPARSVDGPIVMKNRSVAQKSIKKELNGFNEPAFNHGHDHSQTHLHVLRRQAGGAATAAHTHTCSARRSAVSKPICPPVVHHAAPCCDRGMHSNKYLTARAARESLLNAHWWREGRGGGEGERERGTEGDEKERVEE